MARQWPCVQASPDSAMLTRRRPIRVTPLGDASEPRMPFEHWSPEQLAEYYADLSNPREARGEAFMLLVPLIKGVYARVLSSWTDPERLRARFDEDDAVSLMAERALRFKPPGKFAAFCRTVLHNYSVDIWRKIKIARESLSKTDPDSEADDDVEAGFESDRGWSELQRWVRERRELLDTIDWRRPAYRAAFLLEQRIRRAAQLAREMAPDDMFRVPGGSERRSKVVEWLGPWHDWERDLRFHPALPTIQSIWELVCPHLDQAPHEVTGKQLVDLLAGECLEGTTYSDDQWRAVTCRARKRARESVADDALWAWYFL